MASVSTLTYSAQHAVTIDWGDGTIETAAAAPPPATATVHHTYDGAGPWTVLITDNVNGKSTSTQVTCSTCNITGAVLASANPATGTWTIGPITNGAGTNVSVNWGDGTATDTVASGATGTHTYTAVGSGPFTVTVFDPAVPGCQASVSGGNDPNTPGGPGIIIPPVLALSCVGGTAATGDVVTLTITGPGTSYTVNWGDGSATETHPAGSYNHTYAAPPGQLRTATVTEASTGFTGTANSQCEIAPIVTNLVCGFVANCTVMTPRPVTVGAARAVTWTGRGVAGDSFNVDWGDGTAIATGAGNAVLNHTYATAGTRLITWTMVGNTSCVDNQQVTVT